MLPIHLTIKSIFHSHFLVPHSWFYERKSQCSIKVTHIIGPLTFLGWFFLLSFLIFVFCSRLSYGFVLVLFFFTTEIGLLSTGYYKQEIEGRISSVY